MVAMLQTSRLLGSWCGVSKFQSQGVLTMRPGLLLLHYLRLFWFFFKEKGLGNFYGLKEKEDDFGFCVLFCVYSHWTLQELWQDLLMKWGHQMWDKLDTASNMSNLTTQKPICNKVTVHTAQFLTVQNLTKKCQHPISCIKYQNTQISTSNIQMSDQNIQISVIKCQKSKLSASNIKASNLLT